MQQCCKKGCAFFCCLLTVPFTAPPLLCQENENENENEDKGYDDNDHENGNENEDEDEKEYENENENGDEDENEKEKNMKLKVKMRRIMKMMMTMILTIISCEYTRYLAHDSLSLCSDDEFENASLNFSFLFNRQQLFQANRDQNSIKMNAINPAIRARFIRLHPRGWRGYPCLRAEFYGCAVGKLLF